MRISPRVVVENGDNLCWQNSKCAIDIGNCFARCDMAICDVHRPRCSLLHYVVIGTHVDLGKEDQPGIGADVLSLLFCCEQSRGAGSVSTSIIIPLLQSAP